MKKNLNYKKKFISKSFYLEFDKAEIQKHSDNCNYIGFEFEIGKIKNQLIKNFFSKSNVHFFPIVGNSLQESCLLHNLKLMSTAIFNEKQHVLIDWPEDITHLLKQIGQSFPTCLTIAPKKIVEQQIYDSKLELIDQLEENPILFLEPLDGRRFLLNELQKTALSITCVGGFECYLQWYLLHKNQAINEVHPELILPGSILPWLELKFNEKYLLDATSSKVILEKSNSAIKKIFQFIQNHSNEPICIICNFELLKQIESILLRFKSKRDLEHFYSQKVVSIVSSKSKQNNNDQLMLCQPSEDTLTEFLINPGFFATDLIAEQNPIESWITFAKKSFAQAFIRTSQKYEDWTKFKINASQERDFFRYAYRLAQDKNQLFPNIFELLLAASAIVDSNFAFEFLKECKEIPKNKNFSNTLQVIQLPLSGFYKNITKISIQKFETIQSKKVFKKSKLKAVDKAKKAQKPTPVDEEKYKNNSWVSEDHPYSCSFPSEDIFMERLAAHVKKNMKDKLLTGETVLRELQTDFGDGLDLRETIRNLHKDKIMIKETLNIGKADIGAVIFSFADASKDSMYSWRSFWLAEQHDDSNLMFYATPFKDNLIGPGIAKSEFGGFAVIPLPSAVENPWGNPYILHYSQSATDCLILAGAVSTEHKSVLFISEHPPSQHISKILKQSGKSIIYAKLDEFPPEDIRRVRTFHILAEAGVREYAQKYIRKD